LNCHQYPFDGWYLENDCAEIAQQWYTIQYCSGAYFAEKRHGQMEEEREE